PQLLKSTQVYLHDALPISFLRASTNGRTTQIKDLRMARPRLPQAKAEASGAVLKNAGRFADRRAPKRTRPLGAPYARMNVVEREDRKSTRLNSSHVKSTYA